MTLEMASEIMQKWSGMAMEQHRNGIGDGIIKVDNM